MANYATLKAAIQQVVKTNGNNEITGALLQQSLLAMINSLGAGYQYVGIATPSTNPGTPDQNVFYLASTAGSYANFGGLVLADGEAAILKYNGSWAKDSTGIATNEKLLQVQQDLAKKTNIFDAIGSNRITNLVVNDYGVILSVSSPSYWIEYYLATEDCDIRLSFSRADGYVYNGKIFISTLSNLVAGNTVNVLTQVAVGSSIQNIYHLQAGQCLCVTMRASDTILFEIGTSLGPKIEQAISDISKIQTGVCYAKEGVNLINIANIRPNTLVNGTTGAIGPNSQGWRTIEIDFITDTERIFMNLVFSGYYSFLDANGNVLLVSGNTYTLGWGFQLPKGTVKGRFSFLNTLTDENIQKYAYISYGRPLLQDEINNRVNYENSYLLKRQLRPTEYDGLDISAFRKILCIGDSITQGYFNTSQGVAWGVSGMSYPANLARITGCDVTNLGDSGESTASWWAAHQNDAELVGAECVIIELGINDNASTLDTTTKNAMDAIISKLKTENQNVKIFISGIPSGKSYPARLDTDQYYIKDQWLRNYYNTYFAEDAQVFFLDIARYTHICEKYNVTSVYDDYNQGHLSEYGYWRLAKDYANYVSYIMHNSNRDFRNIQFIGTDYSYN